MSEFKCIRYIDRKKRITITRNNHWIFFARQIMDIFTSETSLHVSEIFSHTTLQNELEETKWENQLIKFTTCEDEDDDQFVRSLTGQLVLPCDMRRRREYQCSYIHVCRTAWVYGKKAAVSSYFTVPVPQHFTVPVT